MVAPKTASSSTEINPTNILLARDWRPIIALFRAHQLDKDETHVYEVVETRYRDVPPYIAPEYWKDGYLSEKADIYSFGILMLSLISSDKYETYNSPSQLIDSVHKLYEENRILELVDPSLANSDVVEQVINCIIIGLICVQGNPKTRPDMDRVVSMLAGNESIMGMHIGKPGLSGYNKSDFHEGHEDEGWETLASQDPNCLSYATVLDAAQCFLPDISIGGGPFYKGKLRNRGEIVVRKLGKRSDEGMRELVRDLKLLTKLKHPNVLNLVGYAVARDSTPLLAYDYDNVPIATLWSYLTPHRCQFSWRVRFEIIQGIAEGLKYLHGGSQNGIIIHSEINPSNILLGCDSRRIDWRRRKWRPIIALFSARQLDKDESHVYKAVETRYGDVPPSIAPEYWKDGYLSEKADIYSFGILMLSLTSSNKYKIYNSRSQLVSVHKLYEENRILEFMHPSLAKSAVVEQVKNCIIIGLICVQGNPKTRPDIDRVVSMLAGNESIMGMHIGKPGLSGYNKSNLNDFDVSSQQPQPLLDVSQASHEATQNQGNEIEVVDGHKNQDSPLNSNQIMKEKADCHASGGAIQKEGEEFEEEEVYFDADNPDYMLVNEHQIQDNPSNSNEIMKEGQVLQKGHEDEDWQRLASQDPDCFPYATILQAAQDL